MNLPVLNTEAYINARPFPNCVIDNVFDPDELRGILNGWPKAHTTVSHTKQETLKASTILEDEMGWAIPSFIKIYFQSQKFIFFLEKLTGIKGLVFDVHHFGLHETFPGGSLMPHLDYTQSKISGLQLRVNAILFLNENWMPDYNGELELYSDNPRKNGFESLAIPPLFNRLVIFNNDSKSWHGHPSELRCPAGMSRKSMALNYFTIPVKDFVGNRTVFGDERNSALKQFIPPILLKAYSKLKI